MNDESHPKVAPGNVAGRRVSYLDSTLVDALRGVIARTVQPHELPEPLHALWRDGFYTGVDRMQPQIARSEAAADHWYVAAHYTPAQIAEMRAKATYDGKQIDWVAGVVA